MMIMAHCPPLIVSNDIFLFVCGRVLFPLDIKAYTSHFLDVKRNPYWFYCWIKSQTDYRIMRFNDKKNSLKHASWMAPCLLPTGSSHSQKLIKGPKKTNGRPLIEDSYWIKEIILKDLGKENTEMISHVTGLFYV